MTAIVNFSWLKTAVQHNLHRTVDNNDFDGWVEEAGDRIGNGLRAKPNEGRATLIPAAGTAVYTLPADFVELRFATLTQQGQPIRLDPLTQSSVGEYDVSGSFAVGYFMDSAIETGTQTLDYTLTTVPGVIDAPLDIDYWQRPAELVSGGGTATNPVLLAYPQLYVYGTLMSGWEWVQNFDQMDRYIQRFDTLLAQINTQENKARYGVGVARAAAARFYNNAPSRAM